MFICVTKSVKILLRLLKKFAGAIKYFKWFDKENVWEL